MRVFVQITTFILLCCLCRFTNSEVYNAIASIEPLLTTQREIIKALRNYIDTEPENKTVVKSYLLRYQKEDEIAMKDVSSYLGNPIKAYTLIKRLTTDLYHLEQKIITNQTIFKKPDNVTYPNMEDFIGAVGAVAHLHSTYRINVTEWTSGILNGHYNAENKTRTTVFTPMTSSECFEIGRALYNTDEFLNGISWMLNALRRYTEDDREMYGINKATIVEHISYGYTKLDNVEKIIKWTKRLIALAPLDSRVLRHAHMIDSYQKRLDTESKRNLANYNAIETKPMETPTSQKKLERLHCETLCRGEAKIPQHVSNKLTCRYLTETHPFLRLAPIKMEQLYTKPDIMLLYDVISDDDINYLKNVSIPKLSRATVGDGKSKGSLPVYFRITKTAFHSRSDSEIARKINERAVTFTGLNTDTAEDLQVANYGIGGHYAPHFDAVIDKYNVYGKGHRIATVLFYMSDVNQGGATVFLHLGLTVYPVKGAALFWMNMHPSCELDYATRHAACPVLEGSKWVCTLWLHQRGQEFLRPCNLEYQEGTYHRDLHRPISAEYYKYN